MAYENLLYEKSDKIVKIILNRPQALNALSEELVKELRLALDEADQDPQVRAVILTGAGRAFSAGYDIKPREDGRQAADPYGLEIGEYIKYWWDRDHYDTEEFMHIWKLGVPVIASVRGYCLGGGFWYSMACDITIAAEDAVFGQPEVRHISNTSFMLAALTNWKQAHRWALTGDHMGAEEAYRLGIVNKVVPPDKLEEETLALAERIAKVPEASVRLNKAVTWMGLEAMGLGAAMRVNAALSSIAHSSHGSDREALWEAQSKGGLKAFLEARDGPFLPEPYGPKSVKR
ncbi:MAG: enoyl-CoA hydratase/isomerase family protein [Chloroflexi bacterium]|nr:enoyl-CoA hydratase/isomerase family protein [Chloroflexota bacterium]